MYIQEESWIIVFVFCFFSHAFLCHLNNTNTNQENSVTSINSYVLVCSSMVWISPVFQVHCTVDSLQCQDSIRKQPALQGIIEGTGACQPPQRQTNRLQEGSDFAAWEGGTGLFFSRRWQSPWGYDSQAPWLIRLKTVSRTREERTRERALQVEKRSHLGRLFV